MHLLLVEDDERLSRVLRRLLEEDRHVVELARDGQSGLELAESAAGIEAIILDIGLPDISGLEVARRIRRDGRDVAILMLTARDTVNDRVTGLDAGADDYLVKPFAYEELSARLRALARRTESGPRRSSRSGRSGSTRKPGGSRSKAGPSTSARVSSRSSSASFAIPARALPATSCSTRHGRSASP